MTERAKKLLWLYYKQGRKIRRVSGLPPLTFKAKKAGTLENYKIYGQSSRNLFDPSTNIVKGSLSADGSYVYYEFSVVTDYISLSAGTYTFSMSNPNYIYVCLYNSEKQHVAKAGNYETWVPKPITITVPENGYIRCVIRYGNSAPIEPSDVRNIMLNAGAEALPYEPYGVSVGNKTLNLFDINSPEIQEGCYYDINGVKVKNNRHNTSDFIPCTGGITYTLSFLSKGQYYGVFVNLWNSQKQFVGNLSNSDTITTLGLLSYTFTPSQNGFITFNFISEYMDDIIINEGATACPHEPYGYKVPVIMTNDENTQTTDIYLPEPIRMVDGEAEYIDYGQQKQHFADGTESSVTLPEIAVAAGTNTLTVGTAVQPSNVYIMGKLKTM